jgi:hypothetical protein
MEVLEMSTPVVDVSLSVPIELYDMSMSMSAVEAPLSLELHDIYTEITDLFGAHRAV